MHPFHELFRGNRPPDFVGVGNEHPDEGLRRKSIFFCDGLVIQCVEEGIPTSLQLFAQEISKAVETPVIAGYDQPDRLLPAFLQRADDSFVSHPFLEPVQAGLETILEFHHFGGAQESFLVVDRSARQYRVDQLFACVVAVDADFLRLFARGDVVVVKSTIEVEERQDTCRCQDQQGQQHDAGFLFHRGLRRRRMVPGSGSVPGLIALYE